MSQQILPAVRIEELLCHSDWLFRLARSLVGDDGRAEDLVQDTYLAAMRTPPREAISLRGWLATVARRLWIADAQRSGRDRNLHARLRHRSEPERAAGESVADRELQESIAEEVCRLSPAYRKVILMRYYQDRSTEAIAAQLEISLEAVRKRLQRGLAQLEHNMNQRHGRGWQAALAVLLVRGSWPQPASLALSAPVRGLLVWSALVVAIGLSVALALGLRATTGGAGLAAAEWQASLPGLAMTLGERSGAAHGGAARQDGARREAIGGRGWTGSVSGEDGRPEGGVRLVARSEPAEDGFVQEAAVTDAAGRFRLPWPGGRPHEFWMERDGVILLLNPRLSESEMRAGEPATRLDLTFPELSPVEVALLERAGQAPLAGVTVELTDSRGERSFRSRATTDSEGHARLFVDRSGRWDLRLLTCATRPLERDAAARTYCFAKGRVNEVTVRAALTAHRATLQARQAGTGVALSDAQFHAVPLRVEEGFRLEARYSQRDKRRLRSAGGILEWRSDEVDVPHALLVEAAGHSPRLFLVAGSLAGQWVPVDLRPRQPLTVEVVHGSAPHTGAATISWELELPVEELTPGETAPIGRVRRPRSGVFDGGSVSAVGGRAELALPRDLADYGSLNLRVAEPSRPGQEYRWEDPSAPLPDTLILDLAPPRARVEVAVQDELGRPVAGLEVRLDPDRPAALPPALSTVARGALAAATGGDGRCVFEVPAPAEIGFRTDVETEDWIVDGGAQLEVPSAQPIRTTLRVRPKRKSIAGRIEIPSSLQTSGLLADNCGLRAERRSGGDSADRTPYFYTVDTSGAFCFMDMPDGRYEILASYEGIERSLGTFRAGDAGLVVEMPPLDLTQLAIRALDGETGEEVGEFDYEWTYENESGEMDSGTRSASGHGWVITPRRVRGVLVRAPGRPLAWQSVPAIRNEWVDMEFRLPRGREARLEFAPPGGSGAGFDAGSAPHSLVLSEAPGSKLRVQPIHTRSGDAGAVHYWEGRVPTTAFSVRVLDRSGRALAPPLRFTRGQDPILEVLRLPDE